MDGSTLAPAEFEARYDEAQQPVVLQNLTTGWEGKWSVLAWRCKQASLLMVPHSCIVGWHGGTAGSGSRGNECPKCRTGLLGYGDWLAVKNMGTGHQLMSIAPGGRN